jgi:nifR3 family TIM-barrel protein
MDSFWRTLPKPFTCLAPMDDVTDTVFRQMVAECARPDVFFTEFVNVEGLCSVGRNKLIYKFKFDPSEYPIVAQIWGIKPENFYTVAGELAEMGFAGVDINMGCPVKDVTSHGAGAAMIENPQLAGQIIQAVQEGVRKAKKPIPVSVKTRIGYRTQKTEEWIGFLLQFGLDALTVHGRTAHEMSKVPARWEEIGKAVKLRDRISPSTVIIGNGDIKSMTEIIEMRKKYEIDGVMVGRGIFNNMFVFSKTHSNQPTPGVGLTKELQMKLMQKHMDLFAKTWGKTQNFSILKKFFKIYISGFAGASEVREAVMATQNATEVKEIMVKAGLF